MLRRGQTPPRNTRQNITPFAPQDDVKRRPQRHLHVGGCELEPTALRAEEDPSEDLNRCSGGHSPANERKRWASPSARGRRQTVGDQADQLEGDRRRDHRGDAAREILRRHQADDVAADHILPTDGAEKTHGLVDRESSEARLEVRNGRRDARIQAVQVERVDRRVPDPLLGQLDAALGTELAVAVDRDDLVAEGVARLEPVGSAKVTPNPDLNAPLGRSTLADELARPACGGLLRAQPVRYRLEGVDVGVEAGPSRPWTMPPVTLWSPPIETARVSASASRPK